MSDWIKARAINVLIAGGGTGGHLFPGIAIAESFMACNPGNEILFVNTGNRFEIDTLSNAGFVYAKITAQGIKGLTLPFLSYGGTSLLLNMAFIGILMNIGRSG